MGFSHLQPFSAAYFIRLVVMNMSGPVYQTFMMEQVNPESRAMIASLDSMVNSFGRAFSPIISGWLQVQYGFTPPFIGTITLYIISVILYYFFFLRRREKNEPCKP